MMNYCGLKRKQEEDASISVYDGDDLMKTLPNMNEVDDYILAVNHGYRKAMEHMRDFLANRHLVGEGVVRGVKVNDGYHRAMGDMKDFLAAHHFAGEGLLHHVPIREVVDSNAKITVELELGPHYGTRIYEVAFDGVVRGHKVTMYGEPDRWYANTPRFVTIEDAQAFGDPEVRPWCYDEDPEYFEVFFATFATLDNLVEFLTQGEE